jgi:integrase
MSDVDGYLLEQWKFDRAEDNIADITLQDSVKKVRVFIDWCGSMEIVDESLYEKIQVPDVSEEETVSADILPKERADKILQHLERYQYASRTHALFTFLWHTGCRISGAIAVDLDDYKPANNHVKFRNRPEQGTPLKNDHKSERNVNLSSEVIEVLSDYIEARRSPITDEYGREPLFTTDTKRLHRQRAYKNFVGISRPCIYTDNCPHNRDFADCEAAQRKKSASKCPSSESLHPVRRGSITYHLNSDWPTEEVSNRCDVRPETLEKHYDARTHEDKRSGRSKFMDNL